MTQLSSPPHSSQTAATCLPAVASSSAVAPLASLSTPGAPAQYSPEDVLSRPRSLTEVCRDVREQAERDRHGVHRYARLSAEQWRAVADQREGWPFAAALAVAETLDCLINRRAGGRL